VGAGWLRCLSDRTGDLGSTGIPRRGSERLLKNKSQGEGRAEREQNATASRFLSGCILPSQHPISANYGRYGAPSGYSFCGSGRVVKGYGIIRGTVYLFF